MPYVPSLRKSRASSSKQSSTILSPCSSSTISSEYPTNAAEPTVQINSHHLDSVPDSSSITSNTTMSSFDTLRMATAGTDCISSSQIENPENTHPSFSTPQKASISLPANYTLNNDSLSDVGKSLSKFNIDKDTTSNDSLRLNQVEPEVEPTSISPLDPAPNSSQIPLPTSSPNTRDGKSSSTSSYYQSSTFFIPSPINEDNLPLSLSFMKKPARSGSMDIDVDRIMKQNTLLNSQSFSSAEKSSNNVPTENSAYSPENPSSPLSPLASQIDVSTNTSSRRNSYTNPLVRKKSGELVKSSLKLNSAFQYSGAVSLPTTPTYKQVHFGNNIAVKYFDEKDKPIFISADNSPYNSDNEDNDSNNTGGNGTNKDADDVDYYGFSNSNNHLNYTTYLHERLYEAAKRVVENETYINVELFKGEMHKWLLDTNQFRIISYRDKLDCEVPVFLERCFINLDKTAVVGQIAVKNLSFSKKVVIKYTINNWVTIDNIDARYTSDIPRVLKKAGYDRFIFSLPTAKLLHGYYDANKLDSNPRISFCIQYTTGGHDYWDNNHTKNYSLLFLQEKKSNINLKTEESSPTPNQNSSSIQSADENKSYFEKVAWNSSNHDSSKQPNDNVGNKRSDSMKPNFKPSSTNPPLKRSKSFDRKKEVNAHILSPDLLAQTEHPDDAKTFSSSNSNLFFGNTGIKHNFVDTKISLNNSTKIDSNVLLKRLNNVATDNANEPPLDNQRNDDKENRETSYTSSYSTNNNYPIHDTNDIYPENNRHNNVNDNPKQECKSLTSTTQREAHDLKPRQFTPTMSNTSDNDNKGSSTDDCLENETYKNLIEKYCFFNGPSTISNSTDPDIQGPGNNFYESKFY